MSHRPCKTVIDSPHSCLWHGNCAPGLKRARPVLKPFAPRSPLAKKTTEIPSTNSRVVALATWVTRSKRALILCPSPGIAFVEEHPPRSSSPTIRGSEAASPDPFPWPPRLRFSSQPPPAASRLRSPTPIGLAGPRQLRLHRPPPSRRDARWRRHTAPGPETRRRIERLRRWGRGLERIREVCRDESCRDRESRHQSPRPAILSAGPPVWGLHPKERY